MYTIKLVTEVYVDFMMLSSLSVYDTEMGNLLNRMDQFPYRFRSEQTRLKFNVNIAQNV